jgi:hypothetical protein
MRLFLEGHKPESKHFVKIFDRKQTVVNYSNIMVLDNLFKFIIHSSKNRNPCHEQI